MRVLVADDDEGTLMTLETLLADIGHDAVLARDGAEAWDLLQRDDAPSLAILDWMMPHVDGVEICRRLRGMSKRPYQYLIMLTARDEVEDLVESIDSGADDYLRKPFDFRELRARLSAGERILALRDELTAKATFDGLTGALNRAMVIEALRRELALATRKRQAVGLLMIDLDNFKAVNDTHGHPVGDEVLREASKRITARIRPYDQLGRYGGEEFLVVLPGCSVACALAVAERMRQFVSEVPVSTSAGPVQITASFGVAGVDQAQRMDVDALIAAADEALYRAKREGRNRVLGPESSAQSATSSARPGDDQP